jgi:hypothetical protein
LKKSHFYKKKYLLLPIAIIFGFALLEGAVALRENSKSVILITKEEAYLLFRRLCLPQWCRSF